MRYCLKDVLLCSFHHVARGAAHATSSSTNESSSTTHHLSITRGVTTNISVVTGLLISLCRASSKVTHDLLRADLLDALDSALCHGDERCVLDTMRFVDLLIVLLFEGKKTVRIVR
jgi:E3 ubiquitin-protein ligase HECTD1